MTPHHKCGRARYMKCRAFFIHYILWLSKKKTINFEYQTKTQTTMLQKLLLFATTEIRERLHVPVDVDTTYPTHVLKRQLRDALELIELEELEELSSLCLTVLELVCDEQMDDFTNKPDDANGMITLYTN